MSTYPVEVDTFPTRTYRQAIDAEHVNRLQASVVAIETALGINPQGTASTVADRLSGAAVVTGIAESALSSPRAVTPDEAGQVRYLDAANLGDVGRLVLVTMQAGQAGDTINLIGQGPIEWPAGGLTPGASMFLGRFGTIMTFQPTQVGFTQIVGYALDTNTVYISPQPPIIF